MNGFDVGKAFSFEGRIGRRTYWMMAVIMVAINLVVYLPLSLSGGEGGGSLVILLVAIAAYVVTFIAGLATTVKRFHDRGKSGFWFLISFVPIIGPIWMLVELGFLAGDHGANQYGAPSSGSPFASDAPYVPAT